MQRRDNGDAKGRSEENAPHKKNEDLRILIAVPTFESIFPDTYQAIWDLDKCGCTADFRYVRGYDCATARNHIVQTAIDGNYDYVLMVDNDTVLPKDALKNLLDEPVDVCLGYYAHRGASNEYSGRQNVCKYLNEMGFPWWNYPFESEFTAKELHELRDRGEKKIRIHVAVDTGILWIDPPTAAKMAESGWKVGDLYVSMHPVNLDFRIPWQVKEDTGSSAEASSEKSTEQAKTNEMVWDDISQFVDGIYGKIKVFVDENRNVVILSAGVTAAVLLLLLLILLLRSNSDYRSMKKRRQAEREAERIEAEIEAKTTAEIEQELRAAMEADQNPDRTDPDEEDAGDE